MNYTILTESERNALQSALSDRTKFERYASPDDFENLLNACNTIGIECDECEEAYQSAFPVCYNEWTSNPISARLEKQRLEAIRQRLADQSTQSIGQVIDMLSEANKIFSQMGIVGLNQEKK